MGLLLRALIDWSVHFAAAFLPAFALCWWMLTTWSASSWGSPRRRWAAGCITTCSCLLLALSLALASHYWLDYGF